MKTVFNFSFFFTIACLMTQCTSKDSMYSNLLRSDVFVQTYSENKYDFLFVFDTSGSFKDRRDYVKNNMQSFLNTLNSRKAADYQIAVTTLDMFGGMNPVLADSQGVRGNLVVSSSGVKVVKSSSATPAADFAGIMDNLIQSDTSFWEQGLESAYQVVLNHGSEFSRPGVPLVIIFMTDSDDWSCQSNCWGTAPENNTHWVEFPSTRYSDYFQNVKKNENSEVIAFPIVGLPSSSCSIEFPGSRYIALGQALGGLSLSSSVCSSEISNSFYNVAQIIADRGNVFKLSQLASGTGFSVTVDQVLIPYSPENFIYDGPSNSVIFTGSVPKKGSLVEISYSQRTN
jgi:hypothetical protein